MSATYHYDASGNTQNDGTFSYTWDGESQMKSAAGVNYAYDGDGRRVYKSSGKLYWYGAGDEILAETDGSGNVTAEYIFFGGKRIAMLPAGGSAQYFVEDFLGSSRVVTQSNGVVCYDSDFTPFGGELPYTNSCPTQNNYKFEGKERDTETGDDDFGARYYSWRFGRWLSADWSAVPAPVPYANLTNPQTLNLYAMVADDPESFADLDGHTPGQTYQLAAPPSGAWDPTFAVSDSPFSVEYLAGTNQVIQAQQPSIAQAAQAIANHHATDYLEANSKDNYKAGTNKCNQLVADAVQQSGAPRPQVPRSGILGWLGFKRDPTAHEWADPNVSIPGWSGTKSLAQSQAGDVIAQAHGTYGHAGIVVGPGLTVSVNSTTNPAGIVTRNNWGFRPRGQNGEGPHDPAPVVRSYIGGNQ